MVAGAGTTESWRPYRAGVMLTPPFPCATRLDVLSWADILGLFVADVIIEVRVVKKLPVGCLTGERDLVQNCPGTGCLAVACQSPLAAVACQPACQRGLPRACRFPDRPVACPTPCAIVSKPPPV
jgi:hypothetical protein